MAFMFEKLEVYQKAVTLADQIASQSETFPRGYYFLVDSAPTMIYARLRLKTTRCQVSLADTCPYLSRDRGGQTAHGTQEMSFGTKPSHKSAFDCRQLLMR